MLIFEKQGCLDIIDWLNAGLFVSVQSSAGNLQATINFAGDSGKRKEGKGKGKRKNIPTTSSPSPELAPQEPRPGV